MIARLGLFFAAIVLTATASWFGALGYADWSRHTALGKHNSEWLVRCADAKPAILERLRDPNVRLQRDDGIFIGPVDQEWHQCRQRGFILPSDEQAAFVERRRRLDERREAAIAKDVERLMANPALANCVLDRSRSDCSEFHRR